MINDKGAKLLRAAMMKQAVLDWHCAERAIRSGVKVPERYAKGDHGVYMAVKAQPERFKCEIREFFLRRWFGIIYWDLDFSGTEIFHAMQRDGVGRAVKRLSKEQERMLERDGW